jgi:hypothetical protein
MSNDNIQGSVELREIAGRMVEEFPAEILREDGQLLAKGTANFVAGIFGFCFYPTELAGKDGLPIDGAIVLMRAPQFEELRPRVVLKRIASHLHLYLLT